MGHPDIFIALKLGKIRKLLCCVSGKNNGGNIYSGKRRDILFITCLIMRGGVWGGGRVKTHTTKSSYCRKSINKIN